MLQFIFSLFFAQAVTVAIIDTGIHAAHPHFADTHITTQNIVDDSTDATDDCPNSHGTSVASVVVDNAPDAHLLVLKVGEPCSAYASKIGAAIRYAVDYGAQIITIQYATTYPANAMREAVEYAAQADVLIFAAAGNTYTETVMYPAAFEGVIAVAGDADCAMSSYGEHVDIAASCEAIAAVVDEEGAYAYGWREGTSMAAPRVAGMAAAVWAELEARAVDAGEAGKDNRYGVGVLTEVQTQAAPATVWLPRLGR